MLIERSFGLLRSSSFAEPVSASLWSLALRMAWLADIPQKFEALCLEVNDAMQEEALKYIENQFQTVGGNIENQLQTVGGNIKQFCTEFVHDLLPEILPESIEGPAPEFSPQQNKNIILTALDGPILCNSNSSSMELLDWTHNDSLLNQKADIGMCEKPNMRIMENAILEKLFPTENPKVVDIAAEDSSIPSLFCGVNKSNDEGRDGQVNVLTPISLTGFGSYVKEGEAMELVNAACGNSNAVPSANSVIVIKSCQCRVSDTELNSSDSFSALSNEYCWAGFESSNEVSELEDYVSVAYSERSDDVNAEKFTASYIVEPGMETTQFRELKVDESCCVVDSSDLCSAGLTVAKIRSCKTKTCEACTTKIVLAKEQDCYLQAPANEYLDTGLNQHKVECLPSSALTRKVEATILDFGDSDWEIL
ncbi:uncharacterized protein LOC130779622 isoform X2 [Actinidia eriantha]|uniref:uncharacterized protein LOC130779622 isoform X2 n=1 Tax=Actinidia eriantha TaxID=165200 RepID=UPI0025864364|nr:uncharacterized protein LOC130779622 isoform X2 [Actinidia eriantha]